MLISLEPVNVNPEIARVDDSAEARQFRKVREALQVMMSDKKRVCQYSDHSFPPIETG